MSDNRLRVTRGVPVPLVVVALAINLLASVSNARSTTQTTAFTYQGVLRQANAPLNGSVDLQFKLFDAAAAGNQVGAAQVIAPVAVVDGLLNVPLDFGTLAFNGEERWLEIGVSAPTNGNGPFTGLTPRQKIASTPYAVYALRASLGGAYTDAVNFTNSANAFTGSFTGSGAGLTAINPASLGAGTAGISISGNAATATTASTAATADNVSGIVAIANGGTGATSATSALTNLGAAAATHTHGAFDLTFGNLNIARMPTGGAWTLTTVLNMDSNTLVVHNVSNSVGIGLALPEDLLHVFGGDSLASPASGARVIIEDDVDHYLQLLAPDTEETGVLFGNPTNGSAAGGVIFNSPTLTNGLQLRTGTNDTHLVITDTGNVGIGTTTPGVKLDVNGTLQADAIELEAPLLRHLSLSGAAIAEGIHDGSVGFNVVPGGGECTSLINASICYSGVQLPQGAIVTRAAFTASDSLTSQDWTFQLIRQSITNPTTDAAVMASMSTTGQTGGAVVVQDTSIASATIDNAGYAYFLKFKSTGTSSPGYIYSVTIDYTMIAPFP